MEIEDIQNFQYHFNRMIDLYAVGMVKALRGQTSANVEYRSYQFANHAVRRAFNSLDDNLKKNLINFWSSVSPLYTFRVRKGKDELHLIEVVVNQGNKRKPVDFKYFKNWNLKFKVKISDDGTVEGAAE